MRQSKILAPTIKEIPSDTEVISHQLMVRAGLIRKVASGLYTWLPVGLKVVRKIEAIVRSELDKVGAQELLMPVVQPAELWQETERWEKMGPELLRFTDRHNRNFCLGPTHEEIITDIFRNEIQSYKELPCNFYQIQTKFRDEVRPRFGVMRAREFTMKDGYSFHLDQACLNSTYQEMYRCYENILSRMHLKYRAVEADTGNIGGAESHEFHVLAETGEDLIAYASEGEYAANIDKAMAASPPDRAAPSEQVNQVKTPGIKSIDQVCKFLDLEPQNVLKTILVREKEEKIVAFVLRGDHELNEVKAGKILDTRLPLKFASDQEIIESIGCEPGSIGPVDLPIPYFVDRDAAALSDFTCGANKEGFHLTGVNWQRDIPIENDKVVDVRNIVSGDLAPENQGELKLLRGIEVGHIFQLGTTYSAPLKATILDEKGKKVSPLMGCYGMGITRLVAAIIEQHHDEGGIIWPEPVAPYQLQIIALNYQKSSAVREASEKLYRALIKLPIEVLLDDRDQRPGVKFAEADLLGIPHRVILGERGLSEGFVEYYDRSNADPNGEKIEVTKVIEHLRDSVGRIPSPIE
ncbi:MAG: proline--tRNA ligase [Gammaproteobacteria bacterium]|nr:proline--tRNA ligase [Gammaproteobacteria bacterium]